MIKRQVRLNHQSSGVYVLGCGGMAREVLTIYENLGRLDEIQGLVEEASSRAGRLIDGKPIVDAVQLDAFSRQTLFIAGIGTPKRRRWVEAIEAKGFGFDTVVDPTALLDDSVNLGVGCIIGRRATMTRDIKLGRHVIVNINSSVSHDCRLGDFVSVAPGVAIGGNVQIGSGCWIGIGATIIQGITIGQNSFIGAGAVVVEDMPANTLAFGVPAKPIRKLAEADWKGLL